ncbi:MAG TPA: hypothetical protein VFH51_17775 [Myxococcota bacterium]|nr:hypothetical protein [Myxococcota bacterium]
MRGSEDFLRNAAKQKAASLLLVFPRAPEPLIVDALRAPFVRASRMIDRALRGPWLEAITGTLSLGVEDIPPSVWMKIVRVVSGKGDAATCKPTGDETVAMFAAIHFLDPNPDTSEGRALMALAEECKNTVTLLTGAADDEAMAEAIVRDLEEELYRWTYTGTISGYYLEKLAKVRRCLANEAGVEDLLGPAADSKAQSDEAYRPLRSFPRANVTFAPRGQPLSITGSGYAMASASKTWREALPNVTLDPQVPAPVWNKILCAVHRIADSTQCGPRADESVSMLKALRALEPDETDPAGRLLLSLAQQCETLASTKSMAGELRRAVERKGKPAIEACAQNISRADRMVVAHLDSALVKALLASEPWKTGKAGAYELLLDWAKYHGPHRESMAAFMRAHGLEDAADWRRCPSALRDEGIALGILPEPEDMKPNSLRHVRTVPTGQKYSRLTFLDAGEVLTHGGGTVTRWDVETGEQIGSFPLRTLSWKRSEFPTPGRILDNRLLGSVSCNCFETSNPALWNIDTGEFVTRLRASKECAPPLLRAQAYRYIVSGEEAGSGISRLRAGVWGKRGFGMDYEFLYNFQPDMNRCQSIVGYGNRLFNSGNSDRGGAHTIEERDLETNALVRTWKLDGEGRWNLLVTRDCVVCLGCTIHVFRRDSSRSDPALSIPAEGIYQGAVSGHYLAGVAYDHFTVWDLRSGDVVQTVKNEAAGRFEGHWGKIGFDGRTVVVSDGANQLHFYSSETRIADPASHT